MKTQGLGVTVNGQTRTFESILSEYFGVPETAIVLKMNYGQIRDIARNKLGDPDFKVYLAILIAKYGCHEVSQEALDLVTEYFQQTFSSADLLQFQERLGIEELLKSDWYCSYDARLFSAIIRGNLVNQHGKLLTCIGFRKPNQAWTGNPVKNPDNELLVQRLNEIMWAREKGKKKSTLMHDLLLMTCKGGVPNRPSLQNMLIEELLASLPDLVPEMWFVFAYLGEYELVNKIIGMYEDGGGTDAEEKYLAFCDNPSFSFSANDQLRSHSARFEAMQLSVSTSTMINFRQDAKRWSALTLIANIAMARAKGDIETEVFLLRRLCYLIPRATRRFEEVTGMNLPSGFLTSGGDQRTLWVNKRMMHLQQKRRFFGEAQLSKTDLVYIEQLFPVMPINPELLKFIFLAEVQMRNGKYRKMYETVIMKMRSQKYFGIAIGDAVECRNFYALGVVLERAANLQIWQPFASHIIFRLQKVRRLQDLRSEWETALQMMLEVFYRRADESAQRKMHRDITLADTTGGMLDMFNRLTNSRENSRSLMGMKIREITGIDQMASLLSNPKADINAFELSQMLEFLVHQPRQESRLIVTAYRRLAELDPKLASYYNADVEFHLAKANQHLKLSPVYVGTSKVWLFPAVLENPIDRAAVKIAGLNYKFGVAEKLDD